MNTERHGVGDVVVDKEGIAVGVEVDEEGIAVGVGEANGELDDDLWNRVDDEELLRVTAGSSWCGTKGAADALKWAGDG